MKKVLLLGTAAAFAFAFASCSKCVTCGDCDDGVTIDSADAEICEDDFDDKADYDAAVALVEAFGGCTCS